VKISSAMPSIR